MLGKVNVGGGSSGAITPEMFGCTTMATDEITYSEFTRITTSGGSSYAILNHSLGAVPTTVLFISSDMEGQRNYLEDNKYTGRLIHCAFWSYFAKTRTADIEGDFKWGYYTWGYYNLYSKITNSSCVSNSNNTVTNSTVRLSYANNLGYTYEVALYSTYKLITMA